VLVLAGLLALALVFVASNVAVNHEPKPHDLPVGVIGPSQVTDAVADQLERSTPGAFEIRAFGSRSEARIAILHREIYGAFEPGPPASLLVASAASVAAEQVLQRTFQAVVGAQGQTLMVRDVVALPTSDSSGATAFSAVLSLIIVGIFGSSLVYMVAGRRPVSVHLLAVTSLGIGGGLMAALATNVVVGAFSGHFLAIWGVATIFVLALALPVAAFQRLLGFPGTAVGFLVFVVIGDPGAGSSAPELLPSFWRVIGPRLPPGAATIAMRDVVYFRGNGAAGALLVLGAYAILGAVGAITFDRLRAHRSVQA
jgi:hypothetical protein